MKKIVSFDKELVQSYLSDKGVIIISGHSSTRLSLLKTFSQMGFNRDKIYKAENFNEGLGLIQQNQPNFIFASSQLNNKTGYDLLETHLQIYPNRLIAGFCIISPDNSLSETCKVSEKEIDLQIIQPFTAQSVIDSFYESINSKVSPNNFQKAIEEARSYIHQKQYDLALTILEQIKMMDNPVLAYFYEGQIYRNLEKIDKAVSSFEEGLTFDKHHFLTLNSLLEIYLERKNYPKAYKICNTIFKKYPINPEKIPDISRCMIATGNCDQLVSYFKTYKQKDYLSPTLSRAIAAALAIAGKYYLKFNRRKDAIKVLKEAGQMAKGNIPILKSIISSLIMAKLPEEADRLLMTIESEYRTNPEVIVMELEVFDHFGNAAQILKRATDSLNNGIKDPVVYDIIIKRSLELGKIDYAKEQCFKAKQEFPELQAHFNSYLKTG
ncbi:MAG: tetratricopeptide repeat protein [Bacteriovoracia bacterium]